MLSMNNSKDKEINIKLHKNKNIPKGAVITLIGPRGSGKSVAVKALCYHFKSIPLFIVVSKTEKNNNFFGPFIPKNCIYHQWNKNLLPNIFKTQDTLIEKYGKEDPRTHMVLILDDCLCDKKIWKQEEVIELLMNGRHKNITFIFTLQYPIGIIPDLRANIDFVFIYAQESISDKKKCFEHYCGSFDSFKEFKTIFDAITEEYYCMVVNRKQKTNVIEKKIFRYIAPNNLPAFKAGSPIFWSEDPVPEKKTIRNNGLTIKFTE